MRICLMDLYESVVTAFSLSNEFEVAAIRNTGDGHRLSLGDVDPDVVLLGHDRGIVTKWTAALIAGLGRETEAAIVVRSGSRSTASVSRALTAGAQGYVLSSEPFETICGAIRAAARGEVWVSASIRPMVLREFAELVRGNTAADWG